MKLRIASDHAGYELKEEIKKLLLKDDPRLEWHDFGALGKESVHYPEFAQKLCRDILANTSAEQRLEPQGILVCGSGIGMSIQANRFPGIRAALCWSPELAQMSRAHNASNVLCLAPRYVDTKVNLEIVRAWLKAKFEGGRHTERIRMMDVD